MYSFQLKKKILISFFISFCFILSAASNVFYVAIPEKYLDLFPDKIIYKSTSEKIQLMASESIGKDLRDFDKYLCGNNRKKRILLVSTIEEKKNDFLEKYEDLKKEIILENPDENDIEKIESLSLINEVILNKKIYYPCMKFSENMPVCGNVEEFLMWKDKIQFHRLNEIPSGYIAIPFTNEKKDLKQKSDLRAINAIYSDMENYPFFEGECLKIYKSNSEHFIPKKNENDFSNYWDSLVEIAVSWLVNDFKNLVSNDEKNFPVSFVSSVGDLMIARNVDNTLIANKKPDKIFNKTLDVLKNNHLTIGNLEGAITSGESKTIKSYTFKFNKKALPYLKEAGFNYFMLTNNHCYDYGEAGFKDTLKALEDYDIRTSGAGYNLIEAKEFYRQEINESGISVLSIGGFPQEQNGFNGKKQASATDKRAGILWKSDDIYEMVKKEKELNRFVILNIHDGKEYTKTPYEGQIEFYKNLCDSGADVIFGSHPHVLQPIEWYNNSLIVWSLGNFIFPGMEEMEGAEDTMIVRIGIINNRLIYYQKYPAKINHIKVDLK